MMMMMVIKTREEILRCPTCNSKRVIPSVDLMSGTNIVICKRCKKWQDVKIKTAK